MQNSLMRIFSKWVLWVALVLMPSVAMANEMDVNFKDESARGLARWMGMNVESDEEQGGCAGVEHVRVMGVSYWGFSMRWDYVGDVEGAQTEVGWKRMGDSTYHVEVVDQNYYIFQGLTAGTRYDVRLRSICNNDTSDAHLESVATSMYGLQVGAGESFDDCLPVDCYYKNNYSQSVYLASELVGLDTVSGIAFNVDCLNNGYDRTWDVYMGNIKRSRLNSFDFVGLDSMTLVADSVSFEVKDGWSGIAFDSNFVYDGVSNLVIAINDHCDHRSNGVTFFTHSGFAMVASNDMTRYNPSAPSGLMAYNYAPDIIFMEPMSENGCLAPLAVVGNVGENSVDVVWSADVQGNTYRVEYRTAGSGQWMVADSGVVDTIYTMIDLASGTTYDFRVGVECGDEVIYSEVMEAVTECGMANIPYVEHFEGSDLNPCWKYGNAIVPDNLPRLMQHALYMNYQVGGYAILPEMSVEVSTLHMTFGIKSRELNSRVVVAVGDNDTNIQSFVVIDTFATTSTEEYARYECNFSQYWGTGKYIAFRTLDRYIFIDDVEVDVAPECAIPTDVAVSEVDETTATVTWSGDAGNTVQWMVVYGEVDGTTTDTAYVGASDNICLLSNLTANTNYEVMVYNICVADTVGALMPMIFRTSCGDMVLPYYEPFDDEAANKYHPCWYTTQFHVFGSWSQDTVPMIKHSGTDHGKVMRFSDNADMITQRISLPIGSVMLSFDTKIENVTYGGDLAIGYTISPTDLSGAVYVDTISYCSTNWEHYDISFAGEYSSDLCYIVFKNIDNRPMTDPSDPSYAHYYSGYIDNVRLTLDNGCTKVTNVAVSNVGQTTADITFDDATATGNYTVGYSTENDEENITLMQDFTTTTATLTNLSGSTHYYIWVRKNCDSGSSLWAAGPSFTTECGPISAMPYVENFDSYTTDVPESISKPTTYPNHTMPTCWSFLNMSESKTTYPQAYLCKPMPRFGYTDSAACLMFVSGARTSIFAVLPEFENHVSTLEVSFKYRHESMSPNNGTLSLGVMTDASDTSTFVALQTYAKVEDLTAASHNFRLDQLNLNEDYRIAFRYMGGERQRYFMSIDNVVVKVASDCITPENLTVGAVTSESIALSWTGTANNYNVQYRKADETVWTNAPTISGTQALLTNLTPQTEYKIRIQANCGENVSDWTDEVEATTGCGAMALPYVENFDSYEAGRGTSADTYPPIDLMNPTLPNCWYFPQRGIPTPIAFLTSAQEYAVSGMSLFFMSDSLMPIYAVLPEMNAPLSDLMINFTYRNEGTDAHNAQLLVGVMTNPADVSSFRTLESFPLTSTLTDASHTFSLDNGLDDNTRYYITFKYGGTAMNGSQYYMSIDDIEVNYAGSCHKPIRFGVDSINSSSALVHWYGDANNYEVNYRLASEDAWTSINTTEMRLKLTNLDVNSEYVVRVRALCDGGESSEWSSEITFTTECATMDLPYSEDFTNFEMLNFSKYCWYRYYGLLNDVMSNRSSLEPATTGWMFSDSYPMGDNGINLGIEVWGTHIHDWAVSPQINLTAATMASFDLACYNHSSNGQWQYDDKLAVLASADGGNTWTLLQSWEGSALDAIPSYAASPMHVTVDLSQFDNETIRLAFYAESSVNGSDYTVLIDNLSVTGSDNPNLNCDTPTGLNATDISESSATLTWQGSANSYEVQYRRVDAWNWTMVTVNTQSYRANNLLAGTDYEWRVRAVCSEGEHSLWSMKNLFVTTGERVECSQVSYVTVSEIGENSAKVSWTASAEQVEWEVEYGNADFVLGQGTSAIVNDAELLLQGLTEKHIYDVYVRAICGENFYSEWSNRVQFSTLSGEVPEGIDGVAGDFDLTIYPNPTSGATTIRLSGVAGMVRICVMDINGRIVSNEVLECSGECEKRVDVANLPQGAYFVKVLGDHINSVRKLIVR